MSKSIKEKLKKIKKTAGYVAVPFLFGGASLGIVKGCEHVKNEETNKKFKTEYFDADSIVADAAHGHFYAEKKVDKKRFIEIRKEVKKQMDSVAKFRDTLVQLQQKDDEAFLKACKTGKKEDVEKALQRANLNAVDKDGNTGLMLALQNKNFASSFAISKFLLEQDDIDVNRENNAGVNSIDLIRQNMAKNSAWSPVERRIMENSNNTEKSEKEAGVSLEFFTMDKILEAELLILKDVKAEQTSFDKLKQEVKISSSEKKQLVGEIEGCFKRCFALIEELGDNYKLAVDKQKDGSSQVHGEKIVDVNVSDDNTQVTSQIVSRTEISDSGWETATCGMTSRTEKKGR